MENETLLKEVTAKAQTGVGDGYDKATKAEEGCLTMMIRQS